MSMVTPAMSMTHVGTLLANVDVIQSPFILLSIIALDPAEPCSTGPKHKGQKNQKKSVKLEKVMY